MNVWDTLEEINKIARVVCWEKEDGDYAVTAIGDDILKIVAILDRDDIWYEIEKSEIDDVVNIDFNIFHRKSEDINRAESFSNNGDKK